MNSKINIIPYSQAYESTLLKLESASPQGKWIQLEMMRDHFLSRSHVFENYRVFLGLTESGELAGVTAGAIVPIEVNDKSLQVGLGYDLKVFPAFRKQGLAKQFGKYLVEQYFMPSGVKDFFVTIKTSNVAVAKAAYAIDRDWYYYPFQYLTIPTWRKIKFSKSLLDDLRFRTKLLSNSANLTEYYKKESNGPGYFKTYKMYQIKIKKLHPLIKIVQKLGNLFFPTHGKFPGQGSVLKFATLYDLNLSNSHLINAMLQELKTNGIQYLNVCCRKGDFAWKALNPLSINAYPYTLLSSFKTKPDDHIALDVRCL